MTAKKCRKCVYNISVNPPVECKRAKATNTEAFCRQYTPVDFSAIAIDV